MAAYLIAEEGPLSGLIVELIDAEEWTLGRDPDEATILLEDPMVSRKHVVLRKTPQGYILENLSSVNPATQNGKIVAEPILLNEGDILQIGSTFFRFSYETQNSKKEKFFENPEELSLMSFEDTEGSRWLLKVITGPNAGAEFFMKPGSSYIIGKDPAVSDIVLQDLSVSRQHARLSLDEEGNVFIEDLGSRNGVLINGQLALDKKKLTSQDAVALGTTTFLIIDKEQTHETLVSAHPLLSKKEEREEASLASSQEEIKKDWKEMRIQKKHLFLFGSSALVILLCLGATMALFKSEPIVEQQKNESKNIEAALKNFPAVQFSYNEPTSKVFLVGHVLTVVEKQEMLYLLNNIPYIRQIEDNVVVDELVWQNMNALLSSNASWEGVSIHAPTPGYFVMRGYLKTPDELQSLSDFINVNFPYLDRLQNQVVVESNLQIQIEGLITQMNLLNVQFQLSDGEVVLAGKIGENHTQELDHLIQKLKGIQGIRSVKNYVVVTSPSSTSSLVDLSSQYQITGFSKTDENNFFVVINGKILGKGDILDGMTIMALEISSVILEKDGVKFKINYNLQ